MRRMQQGFWSAAPESGFTNDRRQGVTFTSQLKESAISKAIVDSYHQKLLRSIEGDVVIVGAGPAGLTAAFHLASKGRSVTIVEKRLAPGGGVWGGAMGMNEIVVQQEAVPILEAGGHPS